MKKERLMNYIVSEAENRLVYHVKETMTGQIIKTFNKFHEARNLMKHLNAGGGFDGNTPNFFLK
jgi:hypothetical protein